MSTLLDGINTLLMARGLAPVNAIVSGHPLHAAATRILERKREAIHSHRWWYNVEEGVQYTPDPVTNKVAVPSNVQDIDDAAYLIEEGYLYDPAEGTNIFTEDPDEVTVIFNKAWESIPTVAFNHIEALAKEEFVRPLNDPMKTRGAETDINRTFGVLQAADLRHKDVSVSSNPLFSKWQAKLKIS